MAEVSHATLTGANLHDVKQHNHDADTEAGGGKLSGAVVDTFVDVAEAAAPGTPAAAHVRFYAKADGLLYQKDDAGTETVLAGGAGGALTVQEIDGTPSDTAVTIIRVTNGKLTDNGAGDVTLDLSGGGGGGDSTRTGAAASRPAASNDGDLYLPNDAPILFRDTGSAYAAWGPLYPLTLPVDGDFAWVNQDTATLTDHGALLLKPNGSAGFNLRAKTAPSTPYTVTAAFLVNPASATVSIGFRQSSDGKLAILRMIGATGGWNWRSSKYTNPTTFSADYSTTSITGQLLSLVWFQIADNGTNRIIRYSNDGQHWTDHHSVGRTDFLTADQVVWGTQGANVWLLSWAEG